MNRYNPDGDPCPSCLDSSKIIPDMAIQRLFKKDVLNITNWTGGKHRKFCSDCADTEMLIADDESFNRSQARTHIACARIDEMEHPGKQFRSMQRYILSRSCKVGELQVHREWLISIGYLK